MVFALLAYRLGYMANLPSARLLQTQVLDRLSCVTSYFVFLVDNRMA